MAPVWSQPSSRQSAMAFLPFACTPAEQAAFDAAVRRLRAMALCVDFYVRPVAKRPVARDLGGSALVQPPADRLVAVEADMAAHIRAALRLDFPQPEFDGAPPCDLVAAVEACVAAGPNLPQWRSERVAEATDVAGSLAALNSRMVSVVEGPKRALVCGMNLAFMAAFVDAVEWPDAAIVKRFVYGFPIVGDIPDSGLFRPVSRPATVPLSAFTPEANRSWAKSLERSLECGAASASAEVREGLVELEAVTHKEASSGYLKGPFSRGQVDKHFGRGAWRGSRRFGVWQGEGDCRKLRAIDNAKGSDINKTMSMHETIFCMTLFFIVTVASLFSTAARRARCRMPRLLIGLDDMRAAYRRIPVLSPQFTVFALWSFVRKAVTYYFLPGHNFGLVSAVTNFNRFPHLLVAMCRVLFAVPVDHFFDDYVIVDSRDGGTSGQDAGGAGVGARAGGSGSGAQEAQGDGRRQRRPRPERGCVASPRRLHRHLLTCGPALRHHLKQPPGGQTAQPPFVRRGEPHSR